MINDGSRKPNEFSSRFSSAAEFGVVISLWAISVAVVNPVGEFPIIDDGLYELIVKHLLATGEFPNPEPASATLVTNIYWGAGFCLASGVSFTALRLSTLIASLLGLLGILTMAKDFGVPLHLRLLAVLTLAFSAAYHALSYSFMTDVPFTALVIWSSVFFLRSLDSDSLGHLVAATLLTVAATLSRQIALAMPIAYVTCLFLKRDGPLGLRRIIQASISVGLPAAALWGYFQVLQSTHKLPITYNFFSNIMWSTLTHPSALATVPFINIYITLLYLGLFLLPVLLAAVGVRSRYRGRTFWILFSVGLVTTVIAMVVRRNIGLSNVVPLPESHVLVSPGIGLLWLRGAEAVPELSASFWDLATCLGAFGSLLFLAQLSAVGKELARCIQRNCLSSRPQVGVLYLVLSAAILLGPYLFAGASDRYLTPALPLLAIALTSAAHWYPEERGQTPTIARIGATIALVGTVIFSVIGTRDYLAWHRVTSAAWTELIEHDHIRPQQIDGGEEFNAYYPAYQGRENEIDFSDLEGNLHGYILTEEIKRQVKVVERMAWRPATVKYIVAFGSVPGYSTVREYSYYNWMPSHLQKILVLRRNEGHINKTEDISRSSRSGAAIAAP